MSIILAIALIGILLLGIPYLYKYINSVNEQNKPKLVRGKFTYTYTKEPDGTTTYKDSNGWIITQRYNFNHELVYYKDNHGMEFNREFLDDGSYIDTLTRALITTKSIYNKRKSLIATVTNDEITYCISDRILDGLRKYLTENLTIGPVEPTVFAC